MEDTRNIKDYPVIYAKRSIATFDIPNFVESPCSEGGSLTPLPRPTTGFLPATRTLKNDAMQSAYNGLGGFSPVNRYQTRTGNYLTVYKPGNEGKQSSLDLPSFDAEPPGLSGLDLDLWGGLVDLLPTVVSGAANALTSSYAVKQAQAEAARIRAEAASTSALAQLQQAASTPKTWLIVAAVAGAGVLGYFLLKGKNGRGSRI